MRLRSDGLRPLDDDAYEAKRHAIRRIISVRDSRSPSCEMMVERVLRHRDVATAPSTSRRSDDEAQVLQASVRELTALSALPAQWLCREVPDVLESFLSKLLCALRLDLVYARVDDAKVGTFEIALAASADVHDRTEEIRAALVSALRPESNRRANDPLGHGTIYVTERPLAVVKGTVLAASRRRDFPTPIEATILGAALNHLSLWLRAKQWTPTKAAQSSLELEVDARPSEENVVDERDDDDSTLPRCPIVGQSNALRHILTEIDLVAPTNATVLILGESGTGKELFARELHARSRRAQRPLVRVNCSAIPREMFESEFFGHVRGAFTGAQRDRPGRFKLADRGTIFLDEVGDLPLDLQPKLLRVLQENQYERVGDDTTRSIDVRVIAATNQNLKTAVAEGRFREDLYYRLSVFPLRIPSLRDRKDDIRPLAEHFIARAARAIGKPTFHLSVEQETALKEYDWPGNVRELQNVIERAVILSANQELRIDRVLGERTSGAPRTSSPPPSYPEDVPPPFDGQCTDEVISNEEWQRLTRDNMLRAVARCNGRIHGKDGAAALLGLKPSTLQSRLNALGIRPRKAR